MVGGTTMIIPNKADVQPAPAVIGRDCLTWLG
jgi:hypothetical protein